MANPAMLTVGSSLNNSMDHVHQATLLDLLMQQQLQVFYGKRSGVMHCTMLASTGLIIHVSAMQLRMHTRMCC